MEDLRAMGQDKTLEQLGVLKYFSFILWNFWATSFELEVGLQESRGGLDFDQGSILLVVDFNGSATLHGFQPWRGSILSISFHFFWIT
jgi:hypothetical protein